MKLTQTKRNIFKTAKTSNLNRDTEQFFTSPVKQENDVSVPGNVTATMLGAGNTQQQLNQQGC